MIYEHHTNLYCLLHPLFMLFLRLLRLHFVTKNPLHQIYRQREHECVILLR